MRPRHHHVTASLVIAVVALVLVIFASVAPRIRPVAQDQVKRDAVAAIVQSQSIPNPACNPGPGAGRMGVCSPAGEMALANKLGIAAGDPADVRGLGPIGVDISNNNGCSYSLRAHGAKFVWFKVGEGLGFTDRCAAGFVRQARALHIPYGGYEFVRPRPDVSPRSEAAAFAHRLYLAGALKAQLPPVADVEVNDRGMGPAALNAWACGFVKAARAYLHRLVDIYSGFWFWRGGSCGSRLWEAAYAPYPIVPAAWARHGWRSDVTTWQNSDGRVGPTPRLGADTDVMLHPERYGLRVHRGRLVKATQPKPKPKPSPKPSPKPAPRPTARAIAHARLEHRHLVTQLRARHCSRHRRRGDCSRLYRHNARLHATYGKALA